MNAMILGAGLGTRLRSLGLDVPKVLVDVGGEPLLAAQLRYLATQGVRRVVVNAHHMADRVHSFVNENELAVETVVVYEPELLGTAGGVRNALPHLGRPAFLVLYGDVVVDVPLASMVSAHRLAAAAATLAVYPAAQSKDKGTVEADETGSVVAFTERGAGGPALVNAGIYVIEPALLDPLPVGQVADFGYDVFPAALERGERLLVHRLEHPVIDVGTPEGLEAARELSGANSRG